MSIGHACSPATPEQDLLIAAIVGLALWLFAVIYNTALLGPGGLRLTLAPAQLLAGLWVVLQLVSDCLLCDYGPLVDGIHGMVAGTVAKVVGEPLRYTVIVGWCCHK